MRTFVVAAAVVIGWWKVWFGWAPENGRVGRDVKSQRMGPSLASLVFGSRRVGLLLTSLPRHHVQVVQPLPKGKQDVMDAPRRVSGPLDDARAHTDTRVARGWHGRWWHQGGKIVRIARALSLSLVPPLFCWPHL